MLPSATILHVFMLVIGTLSVDATRLDFLIIISNLFSVLVVAQFPDANLVTDGTLNVSVPMSADEK
jgi:hypothetical protein